MVYFSIKVQITCITWSSNYKTFCNSFIKKNFFCNSAMGLSYMYDSTQQLVKLEPHILLISPLSLSLKSESLFSILKPTSLLFSPNALCLCLTPSSLILAWISAIFIILQPNGETHVGDFLFFIFLEIEYHQGWLNGVILGWSTTSTSGSNWRMMYIF